MRTTSKSPNGTFIWREIMTPDLAALKRFYGEVFGWEFNDMPMDGFTYYRVARVLTGWGGASTLVEGRRQEPQGSQGSQGEFRRRWRIGFARALEHLPAQVRRSLATLATLAVLLPRRPAQPVRTLATRYEYLSTGDLKG